MEFVQDSGKDSNVAIESLEEALSSEPIPEQGKYIHRSNQKINMLNTP